MHGGQEPFGMYQSIFTLLEMFLLGKCSVLADDRNGKYERNQLKQMQLGKKAGALVYDHISRT